MGRDGWMDGWTVRRFPISHPKLDTVLVPNWIGLCMKTKHMSSLEGIFIIKTVPKKKIINTPKIQKMYKGIREKKTSFIPKRESVLN